MKSLCSLLFVLCFSVLLVGCNKDTAAPTTPPAEGAAPADAEKPAADAPAADDKGTEPEGSTTP